VKDVLKFVMKHVYAVWMALSMSYLFGVTINSWKWWVFVVPLLFFLGIRDIGRGNEK
jgi:hypothetical protein